MSVTQSKITVSQLGTGSNVNFVSLQPTVSGQTTAVYSSPNLTFNPGPGVGANTLSVTGNIAVTGNISMASRQFTTVLTTSEQSANRTLFLPEPGENVTLGYLNIPVNSQSQAYTAVASDAGKLLLHPTTDTTARTFTIPANSSVPYPLGTAIVFVNQNLAGVLTIAINSDTMRLAGAGTTGSRTLAANGIATCTKIATTEWIISGTGLT